MKDRDFVINKILHTKSQLEVNYHYLEFRHEELEQKYAEALQEIKELKNPKLKEERK